MEADATRFHITEARFLVDNYMPKVNNRNTRTRREICSIVNLKQVNADWVRTLSNTYNRAALRKQLTSKNSLLFPPKSPIMGV